MINITNNSDELWNYKFISLVMTNLFTSFSFFMITSLLSTYVVNTGGTLVFAGIIVGIFSITSMLVRPISGRLADVINKKVLMIVSNAIISCAYFFYILTGHLYMLLLIRVIHGIGFAIATTTIVALASEYIPDHKLGEGIGYFGIGQVLSAAIAPGVGITIMQSFGITWSFLIAGMISLFGLLLSIRFEYKSKPSTVLSKKKMRFSDLICTEVIGYSFTSATYSFANGMIITYLILFAAENSIENISLYFTFNALTLLMIRPYAGKLLDQKGLNWIVYPAGILAILAMIVLSYSTTIFFVIVSAILRALGQGAAQPSLQAACIKKVGKEKAGIATSTFYLGADIGQGISPVIGGVIASMWNYESTFILSAIILVLGLLVHLINNFLFEKLKV